MNRITEIDYLRFIDRSDVDLFQSIYQNDPMKPGFGQPEVLYCYFQVGAVRYPKLVHISRCLVFKGKPIPAGATPTTTLAQRFWGLSVFNGLYELLADYNNAVAAAVNVLQEFVIGKYKMAGLADMMAAGNETTVQARMQLIATMKSVLHGIMLDADNEDYTRDAVTVTGVSDVIDRLALRLSGGSGIPYTRLWGDSPGGLSTDDESGRKTYYDKIRSDQHTILLPPLRKLIDIIKVWKRIDTDVEVKFNPLYSLTDVEEAQVETSKQSAATAKAQMYSSYIADGVLQPEQVFALEWAERLGGLEVLSFGPTPEEMAQELADQMMARAGNTNPQAAAATNPTQEGGEAASGGPVASGPMKKPGAPGVPGGDVVGAGKA
jgi:phage-related protein (TIGR01555 family)